MWGIWGNWLWARNSHSCKCDVNMSSDNLIAKKHILSFHLTHSTSLCQYLLCLLLLWNVNFCLQDEEIFAVHMNQFLQNICLSFLLWHLLTGCNCPFLTDVFTNIQIHLQPTPFGYIHSHFLKLSAWILECRNCEQKYNAGQEISNVWTHCVHESWVDCLWDNVSILCWEDCWLCWCESLLNRA